MIFLKRQNLILESGICVQKNDPGNDHFHDEFEMLYLSKGKARITVEKKEYVLSPGSLAFIGKLEEHSIQMLSEDYSYYYLILNSRQLEKAIKEPRLISVFRNRPTGFEHVIHMREIAEELDLCFEEIHREMEHKEVYFNELVYACLTKILVSAYRAKPEEFEFINTQRNAEIYEMEKFFEENFMYDIKISEVAEDYYISVNHLTKRFKALTGFTPKQYLSECRLANAKYMLIHTDIPVQDIAIKCGFHDVNNFIRKFKAETGATPYKYKESSK